MSHVFNHMWNIRSKTDEHRDKKERENLTYREQNEGCQRGGGQGMD